MAFYLTILPQFLKLIWYVKIKDNKRLTVVMTSSHLYLEIVIRCCWRQDAQFVLHDGYWTDKSLMKNCGNVHSYLEKSQSQVWTDRFTCDSPCQLHDTMKENMEVICEGAHLMLLYLYNYIYIFIACLACGNSLFFVSFVEKANQEWKCDDVHHFLFMLKFQLTCNTCLILWFSYVKRNIRHFTFDVLFLQYLKFWVTCKKKKKTGTFTIYVKNWKYHTWTVELSNNQLTVLCEHVTCDIVFFSHVTYL